MTRIAFSLLADSQPFGRRQRLCATTAARRNTDTPGTTAYRLRQDQATTIDLGSNTSLIEAYNNTLVAVGGDGITIVDSNLRCRSWLDQR